MVKILKAEGFDEKLASFVAGCQAISDRYMESSGYKGRVQITGDQIPGSRYVRVVRAEPGSRSVHCFVDKTNGDVLMAAGWKAPAKNPRGNIFQADNGLTRMGPYGAAYNK